MTDTDLKTLAESVAPIIREHVTQLALEISTLRDAVLPQLRAAGERSAVLEARCRALEAHAWVDQQLRAVERAMRADGITEAGIVDAIAWCDAYYRTGRS